MRGPLKWEGAPCSSHGRDGPDLVTVSVWKTGNRCHEKLCVNQVHLVLEPHARNRERIHCRFQGECCGSHLHPLAFFKVFGWKVINDFSYKGWNLINWMATDWFLNGDGKGGFQSPFCHHSVNWKAGTFQWPFSQLIFWKRIYAQRGSNPWCTNQRESILTIRLR